MCRIKVRKTCMVIISTKLKIMITFGGGQEEKMKQVGTLGASIMYVTADFLNLVVGIMAIVLFFIPFVLADIFPKNEKNLHRGIV